MFSSSLLLCTTRKKISGGRLEFAALYCSQSVFEIAIIFLMGEEMESELELVEVEVEVGVAWQGVK